MKSFASVYAAAGGSTVDFKTGWTQLWGKVSGHFSSLFNALAMIGAALIVFAIAKYLWERRKGQAQISHLAWTCLFGAILAGPNLIAPMALGIIDVIVNAVINMFSGIS